MLVYRTKIHPPVGHVPPSPLSTEHCACSVCKQMVLAHRYRVALASIERGRRDALRALYRQHGDVIQLGEALDLASQALLDVVDEIKRARTAKWRENARGGTSEGAAKRGARFTPPDLAVRLTAARDAERAAKEALRAQQRRLRDDPAVIVAEAEIEERAKQLSHSARAYCGVYWGTYLLVEAAHRASVASLPIDKNPYVERFQGEGRLGFHHQKPTPFTTDQIMKGNGHVEIYAQETSRTLRLKERDAQGRTLGLVRDGAGKPVMTTITEEQRFLRFRIGVMDRRSPIWTTFPLWWPLRTEIPEGTLSWATVERRLVALREEWTLTLTLDGVAPRQSGKEGVVALDLGWRQMHAEGVRVGAWRDKAGALGDIRLPPDLISDLTDDREVRSRRDKEFDQARAVLGEFVKSGAAPAWLVAQTKTLALWKSAAQLAGVVRRWHQARSPTDASIFRSLEAWRYHDQHLWDWEANARVRGQRRRLDLYRKLAKKLAEEHSVLVLEKFDLSKIARRAQVDESNATKNANALRHLVAPHIFRLVLIQAFRSRGGAVYELRANDTTRTCQHCGLIEAFDAAKSIERATPCSGCGAVWDQDDNACIELLARYDVEQARDAPEAGTARDVAKANDVVDVKGSRWQKAKGKKAAREAKVAAAREQLTKSAKEEAFYATHGTGEATP